MEIICKINFPHSLCATYLCVKNNSHINKPHICFMKRKKPKENLRNLLGLSQTIFASMLQVSESMVSMEEFGARDYPQEAYMKNITWFSEYLRTEPDIPTLNFENVLELVEEYTKDPVFEEELSNWYNNMESEKETADSNIKKLSRKLVLLKPRLERAWKALHFLDKLLPTVADTHSKEILEYCREKNGWDARKWATSIARADWELAKWNADSIQLGEWLKENQAWKKEEM